MIKVIELNQQFAKVSLEMETICKNINKTSDIYTAEFEFDPSIEFVSVQVQRKGIKVCSSLFHFSIIFDKSVATSIGSMMIQELNTALAELQLIEQLTIKI